MSHQMPETIETARLCLRKPNSNDAQTIFEKYAQDPDVTQFVSFRPHTSIKDAQEFVRKCLTDWDEGTRFEYVIDRKEDRNLLGMIGVAVKDHYADAGYVLAKSYWGVGYATEALTALKQLVLKFRDIYRLSAFCDVENLASARVMEKAGLQKEGILRRYSVHPNISDAPRDCYLYAAVKSRI